MRGQTEKKKKKENRIKKGRPILPGGKRTFWHSTAAVHPKKEKGKTLEIGREIGVLESLRGVFRRGLASPKRHFRPDRGGKKRNREGGANCIERVSRREEKKMKALRETRTIKNEPLRKKLPIVSSLVLARCKKQITSRSITIISGKKKKLSRIWGGKKQLPGGNQGKNSLQTKEGKEEQMSSRKKELKMSFDPGGEPQLEPKWKKR